MATQWTAEKYGSGRAGGEQLWAVTMPASPDGRTVVVMGLTEADAKLIAAAPDLLEALAWLLQAINTNDLIPESVSYMLAARAAITRARGEQ